MYGDHSTQDQCRTTIVAGPQLEVPRQSPNCTHCLVESRPDPWGAHPFFPLTYKQAGVRVRSLRALKRSLTHTPILCLSVCPSVCLSVCPSVCLSVCPSVCLSVCPSMCLFVCLSFFPSCHCYKDLLLMFIWRKCEIGNYCYYCFHWNYFHVRAPGELVPGYERNMYVSSGSCVSHWRDRLDLLRRQMKWALPFSSAATWFPRWIWTRLCLSLFFSALSV